MATCINFACGGYSQVSDAMKCRLEENQGKNRKKTNARKKERNTKTKEWNWASERKKVEKNGKWHGTFKST